MLNDSVEVEWSCQPLSHVQNMWTVTAKCELGAISVHAYIDANADLGWVSHFIEQYCMAALVALDAKIELEGMRNSGFGEDELAELSNSLIEGHEPLLWSLHGQIGDLIH